MTLCRSPTALAIGSFSLALSPLQSSFASSPAVALSSSCTPARISSLFATSPKVSTHARDPPPLRSVRRLSQPLDGFLHLRFHGLVPSRGHVQGSTVQGFLPLHSASFLIGRCFPLAVARSPLTDRGPLPRPPASTSRLCSVERCVLTGLVLPAPVAAPLFSFQPLQVFPLPPCPRFPGASTHDVPLGVFGFPLTPSGRLQRLIDEGARSPVSGLPDLLELSSLPTGEPLD